MNIAPSLWRSTYRAFSISLAVSLSLCQSVWAGDSQSLTRTVSTASLAGQPVAQVQGVADAHNTQSWLGVPFAAAPVGDLRWRTPQSPAGWSGTRQANSFGSICAQPGSFFGDPDPLTFNQPIGSEDCLYLNIWRPKNSDTNLPVLFWVHGGANRLGSASETLYNGATFADKANAIVVTVNYRLGSLGWFYNSIMDEGDPLDRSGNFTTLDLIKSLEWVRDNISQFGGNPNSVTAAGQSAGCINIWGLLQSPLAESLVDRSLCASGLPNAYPEAVAQVQSNGIIDDLLIESGYASNKLDAISFRLSQSQEWLRNFLRGLPAEAIVRHTPSPVVVGHISDGHVIPWAGYVDLIAGNYNKVPMILGSVKDEGTIMAGSLAGFMKPDLAELWDMINYQNPESLEPTDIIKPELYPVYRPVHRSLSLAVDLTLDNICRYLRLLQGNIYRYNFDWGSVPEPWKEVFAAAHGSDLPFLFGNFPEQGDFSSYMFSAENESQREALSDDFIKYISQFMRNGNPNRMFDGLPNWQDWSNFWIYKKRLILDNTIKTSSHDFWLSDVQNALNDLSSDDRVLVENIMNDEQVVLEDADVGYQ